MLEEYIFCSKTLKMTYKTYTLLDLIPDSHLYLLILGLGPCRKTYDSKREQFPLIHLGLWLNLLGEVYVLFNREQFDFLGLGKFSREHKILEVKIRISSL